ncbi:hypothetical protein MFIFM68171_04820 [Madurella fahalii]|uniref:Uncharacterized protein n=1 Tax=Madurella fahalii TaxID=1157608 RepID=A0ABQ0GAK6_9PEZI
MPFDTFRARHIPALLLASTTTLGGFWPWVDPRSAILAFGFPGRIADAPAAHPVMVQGQSRSTILGLFFWVLYFRRRYVEMDALMAVMGFWGGAVDAYLVWRTGSARKAVMRLVTLWGFAALGLAGVTAGLGGV